MQRLTLQKGQFAPEPEGETIFISVLKIEQLKQTLREQIDCGDSIFCQLQKYMVLVNWTVPDLWKDRSEA